MNKIIFLLICVSFFSLNAFNTVSNVADYAQQFEEYPDSDNTDWAFPDFRGYFRSISQGFFSRWFEWLGLYTPYWSVKQFSTLLERVTEYRESQGLTGRFVQKIEPSSGEKYIIWGDLQGAFHSFARTIKFLKEQNIIDETLHIAPDYTFIFNGNAIDRSAYSLETLTIMLMLMDRNFEKVIYVRGYHEDKQQWHDETLSDELQGKAETLFSERIPFNTLVTRFFGTLPIALYLTQTSNAQTNVIHVSGFIDDKIGQNEEVNAFLASQTKEKVYLFKLDDIFEDKPQNEFTVNTNAFILAEDRFKSYRKTKGLVRMDNVDDIIAWSVFSSPISAHRILYEFFYDAFAIVTATNSIDSWTIQLVNRDVREAVSFKKQEAFFISSGEKVVF